MRRSLRSLTKLLAGGSQLASIQRRGTSCGAANARSSRRRAEKLSYPLVMMVGMHVVSLKLIDTSGPDAEVDTWIECCMHCGTLDNCGNTFCIDCDDLAA